MDEMVFIELFKDTFLMCLTLSAPVLLVGMLLGIAISIIQTATSIQEQSLSFIPKLFATAITLILLAPWMLNLLMGFATRLLGGLENYAF
ncbi:MAG: flagellar biosynthetic protein FliQ [Candidatus Riflebacteria bacterium]|nr:flagellar biosynthetic protein FliQ [Candidatus Riflebacteria bacterium]